MLLILANQALCRGVSPYLPLHLEPEIEAQIERVLILAGQPVMRRPLAAATVLDALPRACEVDQALCETVGNYLARFTRASNLTHASLAVSSTSGADLTLPDLYGLHNRSAWQASLAGYVQPSDYLLVNVGGVAYDGRQNFTGSYLTAGFSKAQLDIGYKPHWFSPLSDSSMLMSTEAPTMPSVSISNYEPLTRLGIRYELFEARMSRQPILFQQRLTPGDPRLGGLQLTIEPASGWSLGVNRLVQYGGGPRGGGRITDLLRAFFNPSRYSNTNPNLSVDQKATNQEASFTSSFLFPGPVPFAVYAEYAGEDTSRGRNYLLGNAALSWGLHFPRLLQRFDLTLEVSEWQNAWYVHPIWTAGMTNDGLVISNWFGDERVFGDSVGGRSAMAQLRWDATFGGQLELRYRSLQNQQYGALPYQRFHQLTVSYARPWRDLMVGAELDAGRDVFARNFSRVSGFVRYGEDGASAVGALNESGSPTEHAGELFIDMGAHSLRVRTDLTELTPRTTGPARTGGHVGLGARRSVSEHSDLGARLEFDEVAGHALTGVRLLDYRYRFGSNPLAVGVFAGAARYALATPAYGIYYGLGLQWRDALPHLDISAEGRYYDSIARDRLLPSDIHTTRPDSFYDIFGAVLSLTYRF
ncbi:MAG: hypothetical protein JO005_11145 [Gammaproteobacteria bacterium]|nr:hypothetical protein [Gammaproteobacteria bacterium]